jgi:catechol 2,3-dioxygenase-like lactoylglutathione lyase family enzyme
MRRPPPRRTVIPSVDGRPRRDDVRVKGFSHIAVRVSNLGRSARFYEDLLDLKRIIDLPDVIVLVHESGAMLGIRGATAEQRSDDRFDPFRIGLDHLALAVERGQLVDLKRQLDQRSVRNNGIEKDAVTGADHITFYDPDGIAWELYAL